MFLIALFFSLFMQNTESHIIPDEIKKEALIALSHYPELANTPIEFKFKKHIEKSTMQAQPAFWSVFKSKENRKYKILISEKIKIADSVYLTKDIPSNIMIGWLGHELGHIMDFKNRSGLNLIGFGMKYVFSKKYIRKAERRADSFAVIHGMEDYILATKEFILKKAGLTEKYVNRIKRLYLSPEEIMLLVEERDTALD
ncbi:hypothetical protein NYZ99_16220 [Maribacter litopenaei]|uniref:Secreted protein n=1 Tax=Maribacter litopenaei TaxID=2976127 RepID=A0ABY5YEL6_9FLAO|nr:hypothetical protein [Maribacter litopenaei]UWX56624.1 hypothetical protein NYZ99_16220 [Maribacter litopenaei]